MTVPSDSLPEPVTTPLARQGELFDRLPAATRRLLERTAGAESLFVWVRTGTRVDVGLWFRQRRLWVGCLAHDLVFVAPGPTPVAVRAPLAGLAGARYNPVTGELVLPPVAGLTPRRVRLPAVEAYQILSQIQREVTNHA